MCETESGNCVSRIGCRDSCCHCFAFCFLPCTYIANCMGLSNRTKLRKMYGLKGGGDCCAHCCCHQCALCQEAREVDVSWPEFGVASAW